MSLVDAIIKACRESGQSVTVVDGKTTIRVEAANTAERFTTAIQAFIPSEKLVLNTNQATKLSTQDRCRLLKIINQTRLGKKHFTVEIDYDKVTDSAPRINGQDYQAPSAVSCKTHCGLIVNAKRAKSGDVYLTLLDRKSTRL